MPLDTYKSTTVYTNNYEESDYGSDFSPEDLLQLEHLLLQANSELAPPLAIVDGDDEQAQGHFAYISRPKAAQTQDIGIEKEVSSQYDYSTAGQSIRKLVSATLSSPPMLEPTSLFGNELDDDTLNPWQVRKNTRKSCYKIQPDNATH